MLLPNAWRTEGFAVSVVKATLGYPWMCNPASFSLSKEGESTKFFQGRTSWNKGQFRSEGGRVLEITSWARTKKEAHTQVYAAVKQKHFHSEIYRQDIAQDWSR